MKTLLLAVLALSATSARAADIASLTCLASNGVVIKGEAAAGQPLKVTSTWGVYTKEFVGTLAASNTADKINVNLASKDGPSYVLALTAPTKGSSSASGTILQLSNDKAAQPAVVGFVRCDLRLR